MRSGSFTFREPSLAPSRPDSGRGHSRGPVLAGTGLLLGALVLAGCAAPEVRRFPPPAPSLDGLTDPAVTWSERTLPAYPVQTSFDVGWAATPQRNLFLGDNASALREASERLAESRERAVQQVLRRLRLALERDLEQLERERTTALDTEARARLSGLVDELAVAFRERAPETGRLLVALSDLVGWPDRDPNGRRPLPFPRFDVPASELAAQTYRREIARRDEAFYALAARLQQEAEAQNAMALTQLARDLEAERARRDADAERLARQRVPPLTDAGATRRLNLPMPGLPSVSIRATPPPSLAVPSIRPAPSQTEFPRQRALEAARILAAVRGTVTPRGTSPSDFPTDLKAWLDSLAGP